MWRNHFVVVSLICTICGFLFLPLYVVISIILALLIGVVFLYDLPLSLHVASFRLWAESFLSCLVNSFQQSNPNLLTQRRQLHSNGILKNHVGIFSDKQRTSPNLISRSKLNNDQELPESFIMPLKNCNLHSTPVGIPKAELDRRKIVNEGEPSWSDRKSESDFSPKSVRRNVQTVAGPLLVSTRFNSGINAELAADVSSMGFSSRVAQKGSARDGVTHQQKYSGVGVFPLVQLNSKSPKHSISPRNSSAASKAVRVRIAPPDNSSFGGFESSVLSGSGDCDSMKSVLQVLKEMSRKRIHSQVDEEVDDKVKRQKKEMSDENTPKSGLDGGLQNKRGRDDSPRSSEEVKRQRRQMNTSCNNEITSSLSSSISVKPPHLVKGTKRKAHAVDWSQSTTPVSGKLLKVNTSPVNRPSHQNSISHQEQKNMTVNASKDYAREIAAVGQLSEGISENRPSVHNRHTSKTILDSSDSKGNDCVRIEAGQRRVLARTGDVKEVPMQEIKMCNTENDKTACFDESAPSISLKRIKDPGRRLKDMLAAIDGSDEIDAEATNMSPSVLAILKTAKTPAKTNNLDSGSSKLETPLIKNPVSILKTPGSHDTHKSVTSSDQVEITTEKSTPISTANLSPQTSLTTATVVSNSINTSISSASETVSFDYAGFSTTSKNTNSSLLSPSLRFVGSSPSSSTSRNYSSAASQQSQSPLSSALTTETKSLSSPSLFNAGVSPTNKESTIQVSGPSNKSEFGKMVNSVSPSGFSLSNVKPNEASQAPVLKSSFGGMFGSNLEVTANQEPSSTTFNFSSSAVTESSVASSSGSTSVKPGTFTFNVSPKLNDTNTSIVKTEIKKTDNIPANSQNTQFGGFSFGVTQTTTSNNNINNSNVKSSTPSFGGLGLTGAPATTSVACTSNSGIANSLSNTSQSASVPTFALVSSNIATSNVSSPIITSSNANSSTLPTSNSTLNNLQSAPSFFNSSNISSPSNVKSVISFGSSSSLPKQTTPVFGSAALQPSTQPNNIFGGATSMNASQTFASSPNVTSQQSLFANVQTNNVVSPAVSSNSLANSPSMFNNFQSTPSNTAPKFGVSNNNSIFSGTTNKPDGFGSVFGSSPSVAAATTTATSTTPSLLNSFSSPVQGSGFGNAASTVGNSFPSTSSVTSSAPVFGQSASSSLFTFGSQAVTTQNSIFGNNSNPVNSSGTVINGPSSFSAFGGGNNSSTIESDKAKQVPFGGTFQTPSFNFGSSAPSSNAFSFGSSSNQTTTTASSVFNNSPFNPPEQKPFGFDSSQTSLQNSTPVFAFGQNTNPVQPSPAPAFQFNAGSSSQLPTAPGVFNFGAGSNSTNSPFGTGINPPTFSIGTSGGFSIGSGPTSRSSRTVGRARRQK